MATPYTSYDHELDRIKRQMHNAQDGREYEYYARQFDAMHRNMIMPSQNYGDSMQNQMRQAFLSSMPAVAKIPEPVTPLSFLKNADKKLLLTGEVA